MTPVIYVLIGFQVCGILVEIFSRRGSRLGDFLRTESGGNFIYTVSLKIKAVNFADNRSKVFINDEMVFVIGVFLISIGSFISDKFPLALTSVKCGLHLFGNVLRIHIVKQISERCNVKGRGIESINVIVESYVANTVFGKIYFHIEVCFQMISS